MKKAAGIVFRSAILILLGIAVGLFISQNKFSKHGINFSVGDNDKISKVLDLVKENYVDSVNEDSLEGVAVNNLLQNLDPHSLYLQPERAQSINENLDGGFEGVGLEYQLLRDTLVVTQVYPDGPAATAGLTTGDKVISINKRKLSGTHLTSERVDNILKDQSVPEIAMSVLPFNDKQLKQYHLKRGHVDLSSLDAAYMAAPGIGYIKISKFALTTDADFRDAFEKLKAQGLKKLVLDIRGNGGGYLNTATALADEFLTKGRLIVYTKGAHEERRDYFSTDSGLFKQGKLAVLIDEYSASASEILAGALQDLDRAVIIGRRSFGKGLVQEQFPFGDGSAVNLTVARYYTPSGRSIQKSYKGGPESYHNDLAERMRKGEFFSAESNLNDSIFKNASPYHTSAGRKVYSGGGIMPDIFVPADSGMNTSTIQQLEENELFTAYVIDRLQPVLSKYNSAETFENGYQVSDDEFNRFIIYTSATMKEMDSGDLLLSKDAIKTIIKASAARFKWGDDAYFEVLNANDATLRKAIAAIN
jgi:carboxyl-terminal processing protease